MNEFERKINELSDAELDEIAGGFTAAEVLYKIKDSGVNINQSCEGILAECKAKNINWCAKAFQLSGLWQTC